MTTLNELAQACAALEHTRIWLSEEELINRDFDQEFINTLPTNALGQRQGWGQAQDILTTSGTQFSYKARSGWSSETEVEEGYETWVEFLILSHYGAHGDESYVERGNARWLVEEFLPQYPQETWEVNNGGMYSTEVAIDTKSECWSDLFEYLVAYSDYPQLGDADELWCEEERNELIGDCWQWLQDLDLPEGYEWVEDKEFGYCNYAEIPSLFGAMRLDEEQEDFNVVDEILGALEENSSCLEAGFHYRGDVDEEAYDAAIAKLLELGRIQPTTPPAVGICNICQKEVQLPDGLSCEYCLFGPVE